jgi:hypothetical protein
VVVVVVVVVVVEYLFTTGMTSITHFIWFVNSTFSMLDFTFIFEQTEEYDKSDPGCKARTIHRTQLVHGTNCSVCISTRQTHS